MSSNFIDSTPGGRDMLLSIGHSNHPISHFLELLKQHGVRMLADVRSQPYSKYSPQYNDGTLKGALAGGGIRYAFMGAELGGRPSDPSLYDDAGKVDYAKVAATAIFSAGLTRLMGMSDRSHIAMMCSEEDPAVCHRHLLVGRVLAERGVEVLHIRGDGRLQTNAEVNAVSASAASDGQMSLFDDTQEPEWKSLRSVLPKSRPKNSLGF
jgi:uncharacterized protein (DUF488 family)